MTSKNVVTTAEEDYLEIDDRIPGQNYVCLSFVSPEETLVQKELFTYHRFMSQVCGETEFGLEQLLKSDEDVDEESELTKKIVEKCKGKLRDYLRHKYSEFKDKYDDFRYKHSEELDEQFNKECNFRTHVRGVKVRGVFDTYGEAEKRAKRLQARDRSFHVFVGQMGYWLPWDPCADKIANEEYLEDELNTLIKEYKENEVRKDVFYEEQKREKIQDAMKERMKSEEERKKTDLDNAEEVAQTAEAIDTEDPWLKSKYADAPSTSNDAVKEI